MNCQRKDEKCGYSNEEDIPEAEEVKQGWYLLWILILRRFRFIRDLLNSAKGAENPLSEDQPKTSRSKTRKTRKD